MFDVYMTYFLTSWRNFWYCDISLRHVILFDTMTYFPYFWRYDILFYGVMYFLHYDNLFLLWLTFDNVMTYIWERYDLLSILFWHHVVLFDVKVYLLTSWRTFQVCEVMALWGTFRRHDVRFGVMTYFLTLWHTFWGYDVHFDDMSTFWYYDVFYYMFWLFKLLYLFQCQAQCHQSCENYIIVDKSGTEYRTNARLVPQYIEKI